MLPGKLLGRIQRAGWATMCAMARDKTHIVAMTGCYFRCDAEAVLRVNRDESGHKPHGPPSLTHVNKLAGRQNDLAETGPGAAPARGRIRAVSGEQPLKARQPCLRAENLSFAR